MPVAIKKCEFFMRKIDFIGFIIKLGYIVGGYDHSQIGKSLCCQSVCRSVGRSVVSRNQSVGKQSVRRKERMYSP